MTNWVLARVFGFWEHRKARNWGLTLGFVLVLLVGGRFAGFAWTYGTVADQIAVVAAGTVIGMISLVVLLRIWLVPPVQTLPAEEVHRVPTAQIHQPAGPDFLAASQLAQRRSGRTRRLGKEAAALGPIKRRPF